MNPVTRALLEQVEDAGLIAFVEEWDELETLVIEIYRDGASSPDQRHEYDELRKRLMERYADWRDDLEHHWRKAMVKGEAVEADPFRALLAPAGAADFAGNWEAMQTLPAAREAINNLLMARVEEGA